MTRSQLLDGVFEGGGVKGIGLVGALTVIEEQGYEWSNLAGTSAGAIVAALVAAGYTASELKEIIGQLDYQLFKDMSWADRLPLLGPIVSLMWNKGIYQGDYFESWIKKLLDAKGIRKFSDLKIPGEKDPRYQYKLQVVASDITKGFMVVLPTGMARYGVDPDEVPVARAVRMSMSIPFFFEPIRHKGSMFVDGGLLSNFPVWLFDSPSVPAWPTFGLKLVEPEAGRPQSTSTPLRFTKAIISTMMEAHDKIHVEKEDFCRTIAISTNGVKATDFGLSAEQRNGLFNAGVAGARKFFETWDFQDYINTCRKNRSAGYSHRVDAMQDRMVGPGRLPVAATQGAKLETENSTR